MARVVAGNWEGKDFEEWMAENGLWEGFKTKYGLHREDHLGSYLDEFYASYYISGAFSWEALTQWDD